MLIGVSGQPGIFSEDIIRKMASAVERPIIFPLSNPTSRSEATPQDLMTWTDGRAIIGTGSPFPPVLRDGRPFAVDQTNNAYVFPGIGLGVLAIRAKRVTDGMFVAAAKVLADVSPAARHAQASLLPPVAQLREVAFAVAKVVARQARAEALCRAVRRRGTRRPDRAQDVEPGLSAVPPIAASGALSWLRGRERGIAGLAATYSSAA